MLLSKLPCGVAVLNVNVPQPPSFKLESNDPAVLKFRDVLVGLVHEMSVLDLQGTKHPHQDVHEVRKLREQWAAILVHGASPRSGRVIAVISVPEALDMHLQNVPKLPSTVTGLEPLGCWSVAVLHHTKHQKASFVCSCLQAFDRFCIQTHGFFQDHMTTCIDGLTRQFNMASIGGCNRNDIHIMGLKGLGQRSVRLCALCPRSGPPEVIEIRFWPGVVHHRDELGLWRRLNHGSMALANVTASNHRKFDRRLHAAKVAD